MKLTFTAEIFDDHGFHRMEIGSKKYFQTRIQKAPLGHYKLTLEDDKPKRSTAQNNFYWGVYLVLISNETGNDTKSLHERFKEAFLPSEWKDVLGVSTKLYKSTTDLNKSEFVEYIMKIESLTGIPAPSPIDAGFIT